MKVIIKISCIIIACVLILTLSVSAQEHDWRNVKHGSSIFTNEYCDQPYVVVFENGKWLSVFTTCAGEEGSGGQHIVSCISDDRGKTWSHPIPIEEPGKESASWAMPYLTEYGRVYVFYLYNGDKIHELNGNKHTREDMLGWYCYKFSDNEGKTWSERYRLDVRKTAVDFNNDWKGDVQMMWGIGKPVDVDEGMMFAFTKIGKYLIDDSEGWFFRCDNIHSEKDTDRLKWSLLPESDNGLKNPSLGSVNAEHNIVQMNNGSVYCMHRTVSGYPAESYSTDGGNSWTLPLPPVYENGIEIKNPRACPRIWKCQNGKYLFWYHNHGGRDFLPRNPAWISGGIEKDGKIVWSQPEIVLYEEETDMGISYPDLIEQDGNYWITETNKKNARSHAIPESFLKKIWSQFEIDTITRENLVSEWKESELKPNSLVKLPPSRENLFKDGFTIDFRIRLTDLSPGQLILSSKGKNGKTVELQTGEHGSVEITLDDGRQIATWISDPGLMKAFDEHSVAVTVDNGPGVIQFVVDGTVCNGGDYRQCGWTHFQSNMKDIDFNKIRIGKLVRGSLRRVGCLTNLRIYDRPLMNTDIIGNHRDTRTQRTQ